LGLSGSREVLVPFDANHNNICKFATENSDYEQVEQNIMRLVKGALELQAVAERKRRRSSASPFFSSPHPFSERQFSSPTLNSDGYTSTDMLGHYNGPICKYFQCFDINTVASFNITRMLQSKSLTTKTATSSGDKISFKGWSIISLQIVGHSTE
jgi:hypothetical protein